MAQVAVAAVTAIIGGMFQARGQRKQARAQSRLLAQQRDNEDTRKAQTAKQQSDAQKVASKRHASLADRRKRGRGKTLFGTQAGVTTTKMGGGA